MVRQIFICIYFLILCGATICDIPEYYDAIVIEAIQHEDLLPRSKRQIISDAELPSDQPVQDYPALLIGHCLTSKGILGRCMSFRQCYPFFKAPNLNYPDSWVLGMYDTCSYITQEGRQMFGVCCTTPIPPVDATTTIQPTESTNSTHENPDDGAKQPFYPQPAVWPPPLPTHSPDNTIPPLPTHPSSPLYPFNPIYPTPAIPLPLPTTSQPPYRPTTESSPSDLSCGAKNGYQDQERIVGGHNADLSEWPWIAALFNSGRQFCGGSLIDNIHILSAAHCIAHMTSLDVARLTVRLGDHNIRTNSEITHLEKRVKRIVRHRGFDISILHNDIAILTLDSPVTFSQQIRPICLPSAGDSDLYAGKTATVIGWGSIRESGPQPSVLQEVSIPIWDNNNCRLKYGPAAPGGIVDHMLCAGQDQRDSCSGDSGGPLMVNTGRWFQVGIVSWGIGCGKGQYPGVYTRVHTFLPWITKNLK